MVKILAVQGVSVLAASKWKFPNSANSLFRALLKILQAEKNTNNKSLLLK